MIDKKKDLSPQMPSNSGIEVVMIHRVGKNPGMSIGPYVNTTITPSHLESYLMKRKEWRSGHYRELLDPLDTNPQPRFILTFDDGYRNILTQALPILERYQAPCIIFLVSGFVDGDLQPYEVILARFIESVQKIHVPRIGTIESRTLEDKEAVYQRVRAALKRRHPSNRQRYLDTLRKANNRSLPHLRNDEFLTWDEVRTLDHHPLVTIGAHTHAHPVLTTLPLWQAYTEIKKSKDRIESMLKHPIECFSYPYGANSLIIRLMVKWAGFNYAFTTRSKRIEDPQRMHCLAIPRIDIKKLQYEDL